MEVQKMASTAARFYGQYPPHAGSETAQCVCSTFAFNVTYADAVFSVADCTGRKRLTRRHLAPATISYLFSSPCFALTTSGCRKPCVLKVGRLREGSVLEVFVLETRCYTLTRI